MKKSGTARVLAHLQACKTVTVGEIRGKFGLRNPHEPIRQLRQHGHCIYTTRKELANGQFTTAYVIGTPSRDMVAHQWQGFLRLIPEAQARDLGNSRSVFTFEDEK